MSVQVDNPVVLHSLLPEGKANSVCVSGALSLERGWRGNYCHMSSLKLICNSAR